MILFLIVGLIFFLIGLVIIYLAIYYSLHGQPYEGSVYAIEEYTSIQREEGADRKQILYRPIFKYKFQNTTYYFSGGGSNVINKKIGEKVNVYVLTSKGPDFCKADPTFNVWFGLIFSFIGLLSVTLFFFKGDFHISTMTLFFLSFAFISTMTILNTILKTKENLFDQLLKNSQMLKEGDLSGLNLIKSQDNLDHLLNHRNKVGLYFTTSTTLIFFGISYFFWEEKFSEGLKLNSQDVLSVLDLDALLKLIQSNSAFLGFAIFSLFGLISFLSSLQLYFRTYNK